MKFETFQFTHPIRAVIQDQNQQFVGEEVKRLCNVCCQGILFQLERESKCGFLFGDYNLGEATNG